MEAVSSRKRVAAWLLLAAVIAAAGCSTIDMQRIPPQDGVYPPSTAPDTPLVLAIPGLVVPGLPVTQQQHFGWLVQMLAKEGIPCRVLSYDTPEDPVARKAALYSPDLAIAWTRVGPAMVRELEYENERRAALGLPPVKRLVLFGYSQGGVIMAQIARRLFIDFKEEWEKISEKFGDEWVALQNDPEFKLFINALDDYIAMRNIKVQYEELFKRSPALRRFYDRSAEKVENRFADLLRYLANPSRKYPNVEKFYGPDNPYYPKKYNKISRFVLARTFRSSKEREKLKKFFIDYAQYRKMLDVEPFFITASASLFGSPQANDTVIILKLFPFVKIIIGREYYQIKQTELGTTQQLERIENLVREKKEGRYPIDDTTHVLFMFGANGSKGDGFVDQPAAHLSRHSYVLVKEVDDPAAGPRLVTVERERLPAVTIAPLRVMHFPQKFLWGLAGKMYGVAYMEEGNPAYRYLLNFIKGDWEAITEDLARNNNIPRQFMLQVSFVDAKMGRFAARRKGQSDDIRITGRYYNPDSGTIVWIGYFKEMGVWAALKERAYLLNPTEMIPGVRDLLGREGSPEPDGLWKDLKKRAKIFNPAPFIPEADDVLGWTGLFREEAEELEEELKGTVRLTVRMPDGRRLPLTCTVYPGVISFVRIESGGEKSEGRAGRIADVIDDLF